MNSAPEQHPRNTSFLNTSRAIQNRTAENSQSPVKRNAPFLSFHGKKSRRKFSFSRIMIPLFSFFIAYLLLAFYVEAKIAPVILPLAQARAQQHLQETVNLCVGDMAEKGELDYERMVKTVRAPTGEVIYLEVDTGMLAGAKSHLVEEIQESLEKNKKITVSVPFGSLTGWNLFSGYGFPVRVRVYPIGMAQGEIYTVLEDCGINQTRHLIQVTVDVKMTVVLPGENTTVETQVVLPLGERVLVGDVPEIYLDNIGAN